MKQCLSIIRHTLDELQAEAAESYHYEYHKGGSDTIIYSMNLCCDTTRYASKHHTANHPTFYSDEYLYFNCQPYHDEDEVGATLQYTVHLPNPGPHAEKHSLESLSSDIARLFIQNKIKPRMALWRHDKALSPIMVRVDAKLLLRRARRELVAAAASHGRFEILGMNTLFHALHLTFLPNRDKIQAASAPAWSRECVPTSSPVPA